MVRFGNTVLLSLLFSIEFFRGTESTNVHSDWQPKQIHLALGESPNDIVVLWTTTNKTEKSIVEYGEKCLEHTVEGMEKEFTDGGRLKRKQWIHIVILKGLKENTKYQFLCGNWKGWSKIFSFKTVPGGEQMQLSGMFFGDMGKANAVALSPLKNEVKNDLFYDVIFHIGDFAYNMDDANGVIGDQFMEQIEPISTRLPYMTCPGNHEQMYNFSHYKNRFHMPNNENGKMFYSFDLGPVHFISINTEVYFFYKDYGIDSIQTQYNWLIDDLKKATKNRARRPWIIIFGHRPMYCATLGDDECITNFPTRVGVCLKGSNKFKYGLEELLFKYKADIGIWAHHHHYERTWPLYDYKVYNGTSATPYVNAKATIHITTGAAGSKENVDKFDKRPDYSAFRFENYSYTRFKIHNRTHIYFDQVSVVDEPPKVIDRYWIIKDSKKTFHQDN